MTLFNALLRSGSIENPKVPISSAPIMDFLGMGRRTQSGATVTEEKALGISSVWRAVNLIAGTIATFPIHTYRAGTKERVASRIISGLHPSMTNVEVVEYLVMSVLLWGNAYAYKQRSPAGAITGLQVLHPSWVKVGKFKADKRVEELLPSGKVFEVSVPGSAAQAMTEVEILHIPGLGYDGVTGVSPVRLGLEGFGLTMTAEEYAARFFGAGSLQQGVLQVDARLDEPQAEALKNRWMRKMTGIGHAHEVAVLDSGAKFQPISINPDDAQMLETRRFQVAEIARWFGTPPWMLFETEKSTTWGSGLEQQGLAFLIYTLRNWMTRFEQRFDREVVLDPNRYVKFNFEGMLRADSSARAAFYRTMREIGVYSADDIRALEDLPPLPDGQGQIYVTALNLGPSGGKDDSSSGS